jgi:glycosyltransferase involved in cell wall biosynthesis
VRILHFLSHTTLCNGNVNVAIDLACTQSRMGHTVAIASKGGVFDDILAEYGVDHIKIDQTRRPLTILRAIWKLRKTVNAFRPDIIHAHMMTAAVLAFVLRPWMKFKLVTTVHNEFDRSAILMGLGDRVVAVSQAVARSMEQRGVSKARLRVILNGAIGSPRLPTDQPVAREQHHPAIAYLGGLHPRKGVDDLINAFKITARQIPNAHLYLIGAGPYEEAYRELAAQTGVGNRIEFCGAQEDPRPYLMGSDLFVLASHSEPAGLVLTEAREAGCAVIATDVGGIPEMLDGGKAGLLVPARQPDLLAAAMTKVLGDDGLLADLQTRAKDNLEYFTIDRAARDYLSEYAELATGIPAPREIALHRPEPVDAANTR